MPSPLMSLLMRAPFPFSSELLGLAHNGWQSLHRAFSLVPAEDARRPWALQSIVHLFMCHTLVDDLRTVTANRDAWLGTLWLGRAVLTC